MATGVPWYGYLTNLFNSSLTVKCLIINVYYYSWRRKWQPTPVFLPGESHGWRSLVGFSPWGHTESDTTEATWHYYNKWNNKYRNAYETLWAFMELVIVSHRLFLLKILIKMLKLY